MLKITFIFYLILCVFSTIAQQKENKAAFAGSIDYQQIGATMPAIKLLTFNSLPVPDKKNKKKHKPIQFTKIFTENDLDSSKNIFVMIFNPTCAHCEEQTERIEKNMADFKKSQFVLMAKTAMESYLSPFIWDHNVGGFYPSIVVGLDSSGFINKTFLYESMPQINIYSKDRKLLHVYTGEILIDSLAQYAK